jgi:hypothetical protein
MSSIPKVSQNISWFSSYWKGQVMKRTLCILAWMVASAVTAGIAQADFVYTQNFTANGGTVSTSGASLGAAYAGWTYQALTGTGPATTDGSGLLTINVSGVSQTSCAEVTALQVTGGAASTFDVSVKPLVASVLVTAYNGDSNGNYAVGLYVGSGRDGATFFPAYTANAGGGAGQIRPLGNVSMFNNQDMGFVPANGTTYKLTYTITADPAHSDQYLGDFSVASADGSTVYYDYGTAHGGTLWSILKTDIGSLDRVSLGAQTFWGTTFGQYATFANLTVTGTVTPEPGTIIMLLSGLLGLLAYAWRKRK